MDFFLLFQMKILAESSKLKTGVLSTNICQLRFSKKQTPGQVKRHIEENAYQGKEEGTNEDRTQERSSGLTSVKERGKTRGLGRKILSHSKGLKFGEGQWEVLEPKITVEKFSTSQEQACLSVSDTLGQWLETICRKCGSGINVMIDSECSSWPVRQVYSLQQRI